MSFVIQGTVAPGFEPVKDVFKRHFQEDKERDAQCCVYVGNEKVVDLWGSTKTPQKPYDGDSLQMVFSSTKSLAAICIATLVDKNLLNYSDKVSQHWPEFAKNGKGDIKVEDVLRHEAGLAYFNTTVKAADVVPDRLKQNAIGEIIENENCHFPAEEKGTTREYHALTRGFILNEIFRRVDPAGRTIGECLRDELAGPLGADVHIGIEGEQLAKTHEIVGQSYGFVLRQSLLPKKLGRKIEPNVIDFIRLARMIGSFSSDAPPPLDFSPKNDSLPEVIRKWNFEEVRRGEYPSAGGHCSARGLARVAAAMANRGEVDGVRIMSERTWDLMHAEPTRKYDAAISVISGQKTEFSQGGVSYFRFSPDDDPVQMAKRYKVSAMRQGFVGWMGLGGSVFQWHPELKIGFGYTCTGLSWCDFANARGARLQAKVVECVKMLK